MTMLVDRVIVPVTGVIPVIIESGLGFLVFAVIWAAFGAAIVVRQGSIDEAWQWTRSLPLLVQGLVWLLFLPVMAGLWIWETTWPIVLRLVLVAGLAWWNLMMFLPKWLTAAR
ncbi:MAG TPA: hypothetical protein VGK15_07565 [Candidatus Limnocylindria bacterium]